MVDVGMNTSQHQVNNFVGLLSTFVPLQPYKSKAPPGGLYCVNLEYQQSQQIMVVRPC